MRSACLEAVGARPFALRSRAHLTLAALVATAACDLGRYRLSALLRGPSTTRAVGMLQRWSRRAWGLLRLDVRTLGAPLRVPCVYVANHRSYLDIPVLSGVLGSSFVSRADVARWPIVGPAASAVGTVFVERDVAVSRVRAALALRHRIGPTGVVVFPEGTTGGERLPRTFHPGLFRLLHRIDALVVPVTVRYSDRRAYWTDDVTMAEHLRTRVLEPSPLEVTVHISPGLEGHALADGAALAAAAYAATCRPIEELGELA